MRIVIDGIEYPLDTAISGDFVVDHRIEDGDGNPAKSFSENITFTGDAFEYIKAKFITNPEGKQEKVIVTLIDDCCGEDIEVFNGAIFGSSVDWCEGECEISASVVEFDDYTAKLDCLRSTLVYDNHDGFQQQQHPRMVYCVEMRPSLLQDVVMIFGIILNLQLVALSPIITTIAVIVTFINLIINAVNLIPGVNIPNLDLDGDDSTTNLQTAGNFITTVNSFIVGCGRRHPSPLVREYINNVCRKCDLEFQSSILNNPSSDYYNTVYYNAPIEKGKRPLLNPYQLITTWIDENKPLRSGEQFLDELKPVFNAEWRVRNGVLIFERKDFFYINEEWVNYDTLEADNYIDEKACYSWRDENAAAYLNITYALDAVDWAGNEAVNRFSNIVEWNLPFNPRQTGSKETALPFGTARFNDDGIDRDVMADYNWFPAYWGLMNAYQRVIIQNNGTSFQPKLLIWDGESIALGRVRKYAIPNSGLPFNENYNWPYNCSEANTQPNTAYPSDQPLVGLYGRFHAIDNPKLSTDQGKEFTFSFKFNCDQLLNFDMSKNVTTPLGSGRMTTARTNYTQRTAQITGKV